MRDTDVLEKAVGISLRTLQRRKKDETGRRLSKEQSGRAWKFAALLARATGIFGSQEDAERWLSEPALGINGQRPIDLLDTPAGVGIVEDDAGRGRSLAMAARRRAVRLDDRGVNV